MWHTVFLVAHVAVALLLIGLVLLQRGKGAEAGTGFGAGASGTVFGARGSANFLSRSTAVLATLFFVTCLSLVYMSTQAPREQESVIERALNAERAPAEEDAESPSDIDDALDVLDAEEAAGDGPVTGASDPGASDPAASSPAESAAADDASAPDGAGEGNR